MKFFSMPLPTCQIIGGNEPNEDTECLLAAIDRTRYFNLIG